MYPSLTDQEIALVAERQILLTYCDYPYQAQEFGPVLDAKITVQMTSWFAEELVERWGSAVVVYNLDRDLHHTLLEAHERKRKEAMARRKREEEVEDVESHEIEVYDAVQRQTLEANKQYGLNESTEIVNLVNQEPQLDKVVLFHVCDLPKDSRLGVGSAYTCGCGKKWYLYKRKTHTHKDSYGNTISSPMHAHLHWRTSFWKLKRQETWID